MTTVEVSKGDTRGLDYGSYSIVPDSSLPPSGTLR